MNLGIDSSTGNTQGQRQADSTTVASLEVSADLGTSAFQDSYPASLNNYVEFEESTQQVAAHHPDTKPAIK